MFNKYYQSELTYLRELGREFSETNPELAALFQDRGDDPDVDRLLEGFAFLTARIRERIDDAVPELVDQLCQLLLPHYARPFPAASILEFTPSLNTLRERHPVPAGTEVSTRPVRGTPVLFRTTRPIELLPLTIDGARLDESSASHPVLRLELTAGEAGLAALFEPRGVELYLNAQIPQASTLLLWFLRHLERVEYRTKDGRSFALDPRAVRAPAFSGEHPPVPWPALASTGPQVLLSYFNQPHALLFVELPGLERVPPELRAAQFELVFRFARPPALPERVEADQFRPNCVPVVNLFDVPADPIRRAPLVREHMLRGAGIDPRHMEVYSVNGVVGVAANRRERIEYPPLYDFSHAHLPARKQAFHTIRRAISPVDGGVDTYLTVMTPRDVEPRLGDESLSIDLTCSNRALAVDVHIGDICVPTRSSPPGTRFRNLTAVSSPVVPPVGAELHWRLISHIAINHRSLGEAEPLRALLDLYNFHPADQQQGKSNQLRAEAVRQVGMRATACMLQGAPLRGTATRLSLDEKKLAGIGDCFLLGEALDALLGTKVPLNSFNELTLTLHPSATELRWPPRNGSQPLL
jgi:type VI secretion system protein ImpG